MQEEQILDDSELMKDRLLRSLHKARDGHLASSSRQHAEGVLATHNIAILYVYMIEAGAYTLQEHYIFSHEPLSYDDWRRLVFEECKSLHKIADEKFYGVYGWLTSYLPITPLRTGDIFIKIDRQGAKGVRLTFDTRKSNRNAHKEA